MIVDLSIKHGNFPVRYVGLPGRLSVLLKDDALVISTGAMWGHNRVCPEGFGTQNQPLSRDAQKIHRSKILVLQLAELRQMVFKPLFIFPLELQTYPLGMTNVANLKMAIEIVDFPKKNGDFP